MYDSTREELVGFLLARFPVLRAEYEELLSWRAEPGTYAVFRTVFTPHLVAMLESSASPQGTLPDMLAFVEELARNQSDGVRELLVDAVLAPLVGEPRWVRSAWPLMGETTRRLMQAVAKASI